ncbi:MAG: hypothetical protein NZ108_03760, partial [Bacteroidia bacterium]|nr:hypothetical protein [Bacteroidia bacterium]
MKKLIAIVSLASVFQPLVAQDMFVEGDQGLVVQQGDVYVRDGGITVANSGIQAGLIYNSGNIYIDKNWRNLSPSTGFATGLPGFLYMDNPVGQNQEIQGPFETTFNNLVLSPTSGSTIMFANGFVEGTLNLNDRELRTQTNVMTLLNPQVNALIRSVTGGLLGEGGFVSSTGNGRFARNMNTPNAYLFPTGDVTLGVQARYRPIEITPTTSTSQQFAVRFANVDATTEGFDREERDSTLCLINPDFYHLINRTVGNDPVNLTFYYQLGSDVVNDTLAHFNGQTNEWTNMGDYQKIENPTGFSTATMPFWNNFNNTAAFALANPMPDATITFVDPTPPEIQIYDTLTFSNFSPYGTANWNFGDPLAVNNQQTGDEVNFWYTFPGSYLVTLNREYSGCVATDTMRFDIKNRITLYIPNAAVLSSNIPENQVFT